MGRVSVPGRGAQALRLPPEQTCCMAGDGQGQKFDGDIPVQHGSGSSQNAVLISHGLLLSLGVEVVHKPRSDQHDHEEVQRKGIDQEAQSNQAQPAGAGGHEVKDENSGQGSGKQSGHEDSLSKAEVIGPGEGVADRWTYRLQ